MIHFVLFLFYIPLQIVVNVVPAMILVAQGNMQVVLRQCLGFSWIGLSRNTHSPMLSGQNYNNNMGEGGVPALINRYL